MSDKTGISWTDATWNPVVGCDKVSRGCDHCYAIRTAHRMTANPNPLVSQAYAGTEAGGEWTGKMNLLADRLDQPLRWRKPRRIFVNAQSDLFHKDVPDDFIARVFAVMAATPHHTYQVLTKRHGRMRSLLNSDEFRVCMIAEFVHGQNVPDTTTVPRVWPLPNVWLGVSVEDQATADLRIPALLETPAAVRWISAEPLLGPVDVSGLMQCFHCKTRHKFGPCDRIGRPSPYGVLRKRHIDWVVVGGESGPGARPMHPDWARSLRNQCASTGVAFFFKQWGEWSPTDEYPGRYGARLRDDHCLLHLAGMTARTKSNPFDPIGRGHPGWNQPMRRVGRRAAGDLLDGVQHHEWPKTERTER